jgi:hypothetical protein
VGLGLKRRKRGTERVERKGRSRGCSGWMVLGKSKGATSSSTREQC